MGNPQERSDLTPNPQAKILSSNADTVNRGLAQALVDNAAFLALPLPMTADLNTQIANLTKQINSLILLAMNAFDDITGSYVPKT